jgi:alkylation response protein AidB-like acyl-CoA dehydrogenase
MFYSVRPPMNFTLTAEQIELKRSARRFLASHCTSAQMRAATESERGWDEGAWRHVCELGWPGLASMGWMELVAVAEETGRVLAPIPFFSSVCLAANALLAAGEREHVGRIEAGEATAALAFAGHVQARRDEAGYTLDGEHRFVVDGHAADLLVVTARDPEIALFVVDGGAPGVTRLRTPTMDPTRRMATVQLKEVRVPLSARVGNEKALRRALDRAAVALAAESLGGAERCLEMSTEYAKTRVQFDRPIGAFQAIKHKLADMLVAVETARSAAYWAASVAASDEHGTDAELSTAAALAKSYCTEAFFRCAAECIQTHGGIGFTWEHDAHLFLKRARTSLSLLGSPAVDRERIASLVLAE